ncbi:MAG: 4Fe-4S binding protein [Bdellovibrio sp.]|nr:4Fe-4S binding protein [Bdellovibrio sp.]
MAELHYVCTIDQAEKLINEQKQYYVVDCGCRLEKGKCAQSRMDVCLQFTPTFMKENKSLREIGIKEVQTIIQEAIKANLVARPFRDMKSKTKTEGICFCCNDCCGYFLNHNEICDKGDLKEDTNMDDCSHCGLCVDVCYFKARTMNSGELMIAQDNCYGCGLCVEVCPEACIQMVN